MAKQIEGVYERILECAKKEFLEKGYTDASLRTIAAEAETSTNSIYVRFKDKEGLFAAIVEPVSEEFMSRCLEVQETFHGFDSETQRSEVGKYSGNAMLDMVAIFMTTLTSSVFCWMPPMARDSMILWIGWSPWKRNIHGNGLRRPVPA